MMFKQRVSIYDFSFHHLILEECILKTGKFPFVNVFTHAL